MTKRKPQHFAKRHAGYSGIDGDGERLNACSTLRTGSGGRSPSCAKCSLLSLLFDVTAFGRKFLWQQGDQEVGGGDWGGRRTERSIVFNNFYVGSQECIPLNWSCLVFFSKRWNTNSKCTIPQRQFSNTANQSVSRAWLGQRRVLWAFRGFCASYCFVCCLSASCKLVGAAVCAHKQASD